MQGRRAALDQNAGITSFALNWRDGRQVRGTQPPLRIIQCFAEAVVGGRARLLRPAIGCGVDLNKGTRKKHVGVGGRNSRSRRPFAVEKNRVDPNVPPDPDDGQGNCSAGMSDQARPRMVLQTCVKYHRIGAKQGWPGGTTH